MAWRPWLPKLLRCFLRLPVVGGLHLDLLRGQQDVDRARQAVLRHQVGHQLAPISFCRSGCRCSAPAPAARCRPRYRPRGRAAPRARACVARRRAARRRCRHRRSGRACGAPAARPRPRSPVPGKRLGRKAARGESLPRSISGESRTGVPAASQGGVSVLTGTSAPDVGRAPLHGCVAGVAACPVPSRWPARPWPACSWCPSRPAGLAPCSRLKASAAPCSLTPCWRLSVPGDSVSLLVSVPASICARTLRTRGRPGCRCFRRARCGGFVLGLLGALACRCLGVDFAAAGAAAFSAAASAFGLASVLPMAAVAATPTSL
jgi:hypothetical protein